jgi:polyisoprenoid-binding protein YceI
MRTTSRRLLTPLASLALAATLFAAPGVLAAEPPLAHSPSGKSLVIPAAQKSQGTVYYALPERDVQVTFNSKAPVEEIKGTSNRVIGYAVAPKTGEPAALVAGEFHLPVSSLDTGIALRNTHLQSAQWMDAGANPNVVFHITKTEGVKAGKEDKGFKTFDAKLVGDLTVHGVTKPVKIDSTITVMPAGDKTKSIAKGDLMAIRAKFDVKLEDYGIKNKVIGQKVAQNVTLDTVIYLSTVAPEEQSGAATESKPQSKPEAKPEPKKKPPSGG